MVKHVIPTSLNEALETIQDGTFKIIAGGTDLMIQHRNTADTPPKFSKNILYVQNIKELQYVIKEKDQIRLGACTPLEVLLHHDDVPTILKQVIGEMASPALRYVATLAGNIGNASPAGDSLVPLYLLDAKVVLASKSGTRTLPIDEVIIGPRQTLIKPCELILEIIVPYQHFTHTKWTKVGGRRADAISKVSFAGAARVENQTLVDVRLVVGSVYKTVVRDRAIEAQVFGKDLLVVKEQVNDWLNQYDSMIQPIDDQRSTKIYRKKVAFNMMKDFIINL